MSRPDIGRIHEFNVSAGQRELYLLDEIGGEVAARFLRTIRWLEADNDKPIRVVLATNGGDTDAMWMIHDAIRASRCVVEILGTGEILSAGVVLLACGDHRIVTRHASVMTHEFSYHGEDGLSHSAKLGRRRAEDWSQGRYVDALSRYSKTPIATWRERISAGEWWALGGREIVRAGLADEVL